MTPPLLIRTTVLGLAAGGRSASPGAALALTSRTTDPTPLSSLAGVRGTTVASLAAAGELVADKLPRTPSRLDRGPLLGRVLVGTAGGVGLALRQARVPPRALPPTVLLPAAVAGGLGAVAGSYLGAVWRGSSPFAADLPAALIEDAVVVLLCWVACRR